MKRSAALLNWCPRPRRALHFSTGVYTPAVGLELAAWLAGKPPGRPVFAGNTQVRTAEMLRHDLTAAGVPYRDAAGEVFDFHSLRVQTGSMLAAAGVPLVMAQQILDHSTPTLTANVYSRFGGELAGELAKLPVPPLGPTLGPAPVPARPFAGSDVNGRTRRKTKKPRES